MHSSQQRAVVLSKVSYFLLKTLIFEQQNGRQKFNRCSWERDCCSTVCFVCMQQVQTKDSFYGQLSIRVEVNS